MPGTVPGTVLGTPASAGGSTPRRQQISHVEAPPHVTAFVLKRILYSDIYILQLSKALTFFFNFRLEAVQEAVRECLGSVVTEVCERLFELRT
jgi:hypothetical protein